MGWTFGWDSKRDLVDECVRMCDGETNKLLAKSLVGSHLWVAAENRTTLERFIIVFLLKGDRVGGYRGPQWGYKDVDESMGPCEVNCPLYMLDLVPDPGWKYPEYNTPWRDRVRAYHALGAAIFAR